MRYWKGVAKCKKCQQCLHKWCWIWMTSTLPTSDRPFQYVLMDLITNSPKSDGFNSILIIVNQECSKVAKFIFCYKTIDGSDVALEYLKHLVPWFEIPFRIISNRNPHFVFTFSQALCCNLRHHKKGPKIWRPFKALYFSQVFLIKKRTLIRANNLNYAFLAIWIFKNSINYY